MPVTVESTRDSFGLIVYIFSLPDGRKVAMTKTQVGLLREEVEEYDKARKTSKRE